MNVESGIQIAELRAIARRRGKVAGAVAGFALLAVYWLAMGLTNQYQSYATILVEPQSVSPDLVQAGVRESDLTERLHLMTAQILSRPRLSRMIDQFELYQEEAEDKTREEVIDLMREAVRVEPVIPELERAGRRAREADPTRKWRGTWRSGWPTTSSRSTSTNGSRSRRRASSSSRVSSTASRSA
jgi:hypothetical protein